MIWTSSGPRPQRHADHGTACLDCRVTAIPGSATAAKLSAYKSLASDFAAFTLPTLR